MVVSRDCVANSSANSSANPSANLCIAGIAVGGGGLRSASGPVSVSHQSSAACEGRAYEHIDRKISEPDRSLYPRYYGTLELAYSSCPKAWQRAYPDHGKVGAIVLELLLESRPWPTLPELYQSSSLFRARQLYSELGDVEYVHIFIHLSETVDTLHNIGIIHSDIKAENIRPSVLFDFSKSWVYMKDLPCLDRGQPRTLKQRQEGELKAICNLVKRYCFSFSIFVTSELTSSRESTGLVEQSLRTKFPSSTDCGRCKHIMNQIVSASMEAGSEQLEPS